MSIGFVSISGDPLYSGVDVNEKRSPATNGGTCVTIEIEAKDRRIVAITIACVETAQKEKFRFSGRNSVEQIQFLEEGGEKSYHVEVMISKSSPKAAPVVNASNSHRRS